MQCATRPRITELNPHLLCVLCGGYYVDATAITECLHSFCKSCIVRYLETHKYCPICDVLVHKTKPLQNIRPDKILQSIVYKLVPNLYEKEMCNRRRFYAQVPAQQQPQDPETKGEITESSNFFTSNDAINLSLEYINFLGDQNYFYVASSSKRYLRCQASCTIKHLRKLIASKYELSGAHEIRFFFNGIQLPEHLSLLDIAYISSWKRNGFIRLLYQILEVRKTVVKLDKKEPPYIKKEDSKVDKLPLSVHKYVNNVNARVDQAKESDEQATNEAVPTSSSQMPKCDVPAASTNPTSILPANSSTNTVTISSNNCTTIVTSSPGTICTTRINESSALNKIVKLLERKASSNEAQNVNKSEEKITNKTAPDNVPKSTPNEITENRLSNEKDDENRAKEQPCKSNKPNAVVSTDGKIELKKKAEDSCPLPCKIPKLTNNATNITTSSNICKEVKLINTPIMSVNPMVSSSVTNSIISNPITPVFNYAMSNNRCTPARKIPLSYTQATNSADCKNIKVCKEATSSPNKSNDLPAIIKKPIKTAKTFTRPWNSTCTPTTVAVKPITVAEAKSTPQKPVRFFKSRNTPRFLGNPASGIRPLYQVNPSETRNDGNDGKKTSKNVSVLKIDPKTLCPIVSSSASVTPTSSPSSSVNCKKPFPYLPPSPIPKLYPPSSSDYPSSTNSANYVGNLPAITSAAISGKLPTASFPYPNISHNPLLSSMNPLLYGIYPSHFASADSSMNGPTSLDLMKAMAAFHPSFPPSINPLYNPHAKLKHDKNPKTSTKPVPSPPAIQRVPPSSKSVGESVDVKTSAAGSANVSNGVYKNKNKKSEISSFAINNLIPIDDAKNVSHDCSADGVHQVCDQTPSNGEKSSDKKTEKHDEQKETEVEKSASK